jgi:hypothetical protein
VLEFVFYPSSQCRERNFAHPLLEETESNHRSG